MSERDAAGRFAPGHSGNPGGRLRDDVRPLAREYGAEAIDKLVAIMRDGEPEVALRAAVALLDRGWGKPAQAITGDGGGPIALSAVRTIEEAERLALEALRNLPKLTGDEGGTGDAERA